MQTEQAFRQAAIEPAKTPMSPALRCNIITYHTRLKINDVFTPPNAKLFDIT